MSTLEERTRPSMMTTVAFQCGNTADYEGLPNEWSAFLDTPPNDHGGLFNSTILGRPPCPDAIDHLSGHPSLLNTEPNVEALVSQSSPRGRPSYEKAASPVRNAKTLDQALAVNARAIEIRDSLSMKLNTTEMRVSMLTYLSVLFASPRAILAFTELLPSIYGLYDVQLPSA